MSKVIVDSYSGSVKVYPGLKVVKFFKSKHHDLFIRELAWLKIMRDWDRVPQVFKWQNNIIEMSYCGERITKETIPVNWEVQMDSILRGLRVFNCSHNDIKPREILVNDGRLYLVDFGWATRIGEPIPRHFPKALGCQFRKGIHNFDDAHSFLKAVEYVLEN